ncbi:discoidin domain-containing protein [Myxococcus xanthus]|nr:discoidin domain-containing protein [Myxococcus xanthus]
MSPTRMFRLPWLVSIAGAALLGACSPDASAEQLPPDDLTSTTARQALLSPPNLALGKPALQSSAYLGGGGEPSLAVDGNTDGDFWAGSVTHTALQSQQTQPWWQVDLQASHLISNVVLYNRTDCCSDRLQNFRVRISEDGTTWQDHPFAGVAPRRTSLSINSKARYVRVQLGNTNNPLSLAEVQVFGAATHMHFGGMYGFFNGGTYVNPYTGGPSCPPEYTAYQTLGTTNVDYNMYFCGRHAVDGNVPLAEFGGAYGFGSIGDYKNDITQAASCPDGYLTDAALGSSGIDYDLRYCHRPYEPHLPSPYRFGGMYGEGSGGPYVNPLTGQASCPDGFKAVQILGTSGVDYPVFFCYRKQ